MEGYPAAIVPVNHVEPAPRRVRAMVGGRWAFDTTQALYVWEWPPYPHYYVPMADVDPRLLADAGRTEDDARGRAHLYGLVAGATVRPDAVRVYSDSQLDGVRGTARFDWTALDQWFEEDEEVFVHPRSPYTRVDALRSTRHVRVSLDGLLLAESFSPVMVFETGLPTRYYLNQTDVEVTRMEASETVSSCPYKGTTSHYWSVRSDSGACPDAAWSYGFPTRQLLPIAGMVAFYNEKVDIALDGVPLPRPITHFSP